MKPLTELVGSSPGIVALRDQVSRLLKTWSTTRRPPPVLIQGETGTGKGLLARAIHRASPRADAPFVDINCAAVPETLLEAELFGYERGAFTDAKQAKPGLFQLAHRGTLFLDEVALLPPALQAKLLSVLEDRAVRRLGATRSEPVDVWVIAATNEDLAQALRDRRFRADLYHRLAVVSLGLPALRNRGEDIVVLAEHFLARACADYGLPQKSLTSDARAALVSYRWPGNVRELSNLLERTALLAESTTLTADHLAIPDDAPTASATDAPPDAAAPTAPVTRSSRDTMRDHLERVLAQTSWNISRTAALLGVSRNTVMARITRFGLHGPRKAGTAPAASAEPPMRDAATTTPRSATPQSPRWERRRLTFVRVVFPARADGDIEPAIAAQLHVAAEKLRAFGARVEDGGPATLLSVFGLDERDEPAVLAGHGALVVRNAARHAVSDGDAAALRVGLHVAEILVRTGVSAPALDPDGSRDAWNAVAATVALAPPGTIVASPAAAALLRRRFSLAPLGADAVAYRLDGLARSDALGSNERTLFVGRREELALLQARLTTATNGHSQVVHLVADVGMGKSRLVLELAASARGVLYLEGRCMPGEVHTPFAPLLQVLRTVAGIGEPDGSEAIRAKVAAALAQAHVADDEVQQDLVHLLDATSPMPPATGSLAARARLFAAIRRLLVAESARHPLLLVVEDLHWIDPSSEAFLVAFVEVLHDLRVLLLVSYRPAYRPPWMASSHVLSLALPPLSEQESLAVIRGVVRAGAGVVAAERDINARAEGNPLFLEELARGALEGSPTATEVPATVDDAIAGRLTRLAPRARRVLRGLAVIGRDAPVSLGRAVLEIDDEAFRAATDELRRADFVHETGVDGEIGYAFRHALVQEVAYARIPAVERRALHVRVLDTMERLYPDRGADRVERLAHHAVLGQAHDRAVGYLLQAGEKAAARSALAEARVHFERGVALAARLPEGPERDREDFALESARARVLMATEGYAAPETERALARAHELGRRVGDTLKLGPVLMGQWALFLLKAQYATAADAAEALRALGVEDETPLVLAAAYRAVGMTDLFLGKFMDARAHLERAIAVYRPEEHAVRALNEYGGHPHSACLAYLGRTLHFLGYPDQALRRCEEALAQARQWSGPLGIAQMLGMLSTIHQVRRDLDATWETSEKALAYAKDKGIAHWIVQSTIVRGWARGIMATTASERAAALEEMREAIDRYRSSGTILGLSEYLALLAEVHAAGHDVPHAVTILDEAQAHVETTGERYFEAELHRLRGEFVLLAAGPDAATTAETALRRALECAAVQHARTSELRAATGLARLLQRRHANNEARALLAPVFAWFTEGFETADGRAARAALDELGAISGRIPT